MLILWSTSAKWYVTVFSIIHAISGSIACLASCSRAHVPCDLLQGIVWIKERESKHNLKVVRMGAPSTVTAMERAMEAGHSVLIENMGENIDAVLNPVITRSTFKKVS